MIVDSKTRLLVISTHPDDEALGVGGLIGKAKLEGAKVQLVYICVGKSRQLVTNSTNEKVRLKEIKDVEKLIQDKVKIMYVGKEFTRLDMVPQKELIERIEDIIEDFKPTIITIPTSGSYNQDHRATYEAAITALRPTPKKVRHFTPYVLEYFEPYFWAVTTPKTPNTYLDLSQKYKGETLFDFKIALYKCHKTQVRKDPFPRSIENLASLARVYGKEIGIEMAEAYYLLRAEIW